MGFPESTQKVLVSTFNNYYCINGCFNSLYSRICSGSFYLFNFLKMNAKKLVINFLILSTSIFLPLFAFSFFDYLSVENSRNNEKALSGKISAVKKGYIPNFSPNDLLKLDNIPAVYPIGSLPNTKTLMSDEGYGTITYKSDKFGLRNSNKKWFEINKKSSIFLIGDSFVAGWSVPQESTISDNLEMFTKTNTINLGTGGNDPYEYMAILKSIIKPIVDNNKSIKTNIVVLVFYPNDKKPRNLKKEKLLSSLDSIIEFSDAEGVIPSNFYLKNTEEFIKNNYDISHEKLISTLKKIHFRYSPFIKVVTLYPITKRIRGAITKFSSHRSDLEISTNSTSQKAILLLSEICKYNCKPLVAYIPNNKTLYPYLETKQYKMELESISGKLNIPFVDGESIIDGNTFDDYSPKGGHLSKKGYKKIANSISEKINELKLLKIDQNN